MEKPIFIDYEECNKELSKEKLKVITELKNLALKYDIKIVCAKERKL